MNHTELGTDLDPDGTTEQGAVPSYDGTLTKWSGAQHTVLVVDDDSDTRDLIVTMLERDGLTTIQATGGDDALTVARRQFPDLVILDVVMPGTDGYMVVRQLREDTALRDVPVIMVTARTAVWDEVFGLTSGADAYLAKPVVRADLMRWVHELL